MFTTYKYSLTEAILFLPGKHNQKRLQQRLAGKTVLITGASFGIGESLACILAPSGAQLILVARTREKLMEVQQRVAALGGTALIFPTDLSKHEDVTSLLKFVHALPSGIDVVVSNAGKSIRRPVIESLDRLHDITRTISVNYTGPVQLLLSLIPMLQKNKGHIINVSSVAVLLAPAPYWAAYQASKAAFDGWFRSVQPELNASGVRTSSVYLPLVKTRMMAPTAGYQHLPAMSPDHVASIVCRCIISGKQKYTPWWLIFGQLASIVFRRPWEALNTYRLNRKQQNA